MPFSGLGAGTEAAIKAGLGVGFKCLRVGLGADVGADAIMNRLFSCFLEICVKIT